MLTDSTILKSIGMPSPLSPILWRIPFMKTSPDWPRMLGFEGEPKFESVYELEVSLLNWVVSWMSMTSICAREMIVTFLGMSKMLSSVPKTDWKGRDVGRICCSIGTSFTWYFSICTAGVAAADPWTWLEVGVVVVDESVAGAGLGVCARLSGVSAARVKLATSPKRLVWCMVLGMRKAFDMPITWLAPAQSSDGRTPLRH